jgi:hypothetical protein
VKQVSARVERQDASRALFSNVPTCYIRDDIQVAPLSTLNAVLGGWNLTPRGQAQRRYDALYSADALMPRFLTGE